MTHLKIASIVKISSLAACLVMLSACATALERRAPGDIASRAYRSADSYTGLEQVKLPAISPFSWDSNVRGQAQLQSAEVYDGQNGGAWLDVALLYATPGDSPDQMRVYNKIRWDGGDAAKLADFSAAVQTCSDRVSEYPGGGYYGRSGYGHGGNGLGDFSFAIGSALAGRGHRHRGERGRGSQSRSDDRHSNSNQANSNQGSDTAANTVSGDSSEQQPVTPTDVSRRPIDGPYMGRARVRASAGNTQPVTRATSRRERSTPKSTARSNASKSSTRSSRSTSSSRSHARVNFQNDTLASLAADTSGVKATPKTSQKTSSSHQKHYGFGNRFGGRHNGYRYNRGFYGSMHGYASSQYVITSACMRREKLRVFVPSQKLREAEQAGLTLHIRGLSGDERALSLTPNYILGYQMASGAATPVNVASPSYTGTAN